MQPKVRNRYKTSIFMNPFDGRFVKRMDTSYGGIDTNLATESRVLPKERERIESNRKKESYI